jgi:poly-beta-1,6-N-acetyl-D-glucosamine biosynthesis protein PgaD
MPAAGCRKTATKQLITSISLAEGGALYRIRPAVNPRPIINARRQMQWRHRLFSDAGTLALWSAWLWMCRPAILGGVGMLGVAFGMRRPAAGTPAANALPSVEEMALLLVGVAALLLLWNRLSREPAVRPRVNVLPDFQRHFGLGAEAIDAARDSHRVVVHHDDQGRIIAIEPATPTRDPRPADDRPFSAAA